MQAWDEPASCMGSHPLAQRAAPAAHACLGRTLFTTRCNKSFCRLGPKHAGSRSTDWVTSTW